MNSQKALVYYAVAVGVLCLIAFLSNPWSAWSALISGGALISISLGLRYLMKSKPDLAWCLLVIFLILVVGGLGYRAFLTFGIAFEGRESKIIAASCMSGIVFVSVWFLGFLFGGKKKLD